MTQITLQALQKVGGKERLKRRVLKTRSGDGADVMWRGVVVCSRHDHLWS